MKTETRPLMNAAYHLLLVLALRAGIIFMVELMTYCGAYANDLTKPGLPMKSLVYCSEASPTGFDPNCYISIRIEPRWAGFRTVHKRFHRQSRFCQVICIRTTIRHQFDHEDDPCSKRQHQSKWYAAFMRGRVSVFIKNQCLSRSLYLLCAIWIEHGGE